jgi:hypothetical protein
VPLQFASQRLARPRVDLNAEGLEKTELLSKQPLCSLVQIRKGMAVTVEIKTGARRVISYLLSPLMRYKQESLSER